jgi:hypothetical protein
MKYYTLITYPGQRKQHLMTTSDSAVSADPANRYLLSQIGDRLLEENVISSYQIVVADEDEVYSSQRTIQ